MCFSNEQPNNLNTIKDMLAGLPQFQEGKELYSLHLGMAQEAVNVFQKRRLADIATVEQVRQVVTLSLHGNLELI